MEGPSLRSGCRCRIARFETLCPWPHVRGRSFGRCPLRGRRLRSTPPRRRPHGAPTRMLEGLRRSSGHHRRAARDHGPFGTHGTRRPRFPTDARGSGVPAAGCLGTGPAVRGDARRARERGDGPAVRPGCIRALPASSREGGQRTPCPLASHQERQALAVPPGERPAHGSRRTSARGPPGAPRRRSVPARRDAARSRTGGPTRERWWAAGFPRMARTVPGRSRGPRRNPGRRGAEALGGSPARAHATPLPVRVRRTV